MAHDARIGKASAAGQRYHYPLSLIFHAPVDTLAAPGRARVPGPASPDQTRFSMKKWECVVCGFIYDEEEGLPEEGIEPGTKWDDIPDDWVCPDCGVGKEDFEMVEI
tara:strand:- start:107 stop:427 length:321 start_codon:yes stop_codon:yes gene_type:complete